MIKGEITMEELDAKAEEVTFRIVGMLEERGHKVEVNRGEWASNVTITRVDDHYIGLRVYPEQSSSSYRCSYTGKLRMKMKEGGSSWKDKNYPESKAGFATPKTIERIENVIACNERENERKAKRAEEEDAASKTLKKTAELLGKEAIHGGIYVGTNKIEASSKEKVKLVAYITPEQMVKIAAILGDK